MMKNPLQTFNDNNPKIWPKKKKFEYCKLFLQVFKTIKK